MRNSGDLFPTCLPDIYCMCPTHTYNTYTHTSCSLLCYFAFLFHTYRYPAIYSLALFPTLPFLLYTPCFSIPLLTSVSGRSHTIQPLFLVHRFFLLFLPSCPPWFPFFHCITVIYTFTHLEQSNRWPSLKVVLLRALSCTFNCPPQCAAGSSMFLNAKR